ncbi:MAG: hypothetical protein WDA20_13145 [Desulfuromonadales bacterium]
MGNDEKLRRTRLLTQVNRLLDEYQDSWSAEETDGGILISFNAEPAAVAEPEQADDADDGGEVILTALTVADLRTLAEAEGIDLAGIDRKAEIIEAIEAARAGETAEQD